MSWKSIVSVGLLCILVAPATAAPTLSIDLIRSGGTPVLAANGDWQWQVSVAADPTRFVTTDEGTGGSLGIEIGLVFTGAAVTGAIVNETNFPFANVGTSPFDFGGDPDEGLTIGTGEDSNSIFAALGSTFFTDSALKEVFTVTTSKPIHPGNLTTNVQWLGAFGGNALIAQDDGIAGGPDVFTDGFSGSLNKTVLGGDANFTGAVNNADVNALGIHFNQAGFKIWTQGDFNGTGNVNNADVNILGLNFNQPGITPPGSGGLAALPIPEPASVAMCVLGICAMGLIGRRRS